MKKKINIASGILTLLIGCSVAGTYGRGGDLTTIGYLMVLFVLSAYIFLQLADDNIHLIKTKQPIKRIGGTYCENPYKR